VRQEVAPQIVDTQLPHINAFGLPQLSELLKRPKPPRSQNSLITGDDQPFDTIQRLNQLHALHLSEHEHSGCQRVGVGRVLGDDCRAQQIIRSIPGLWIDDMRCPRLFAEIPLIIPAGRDRHVFEVDNGDILGFVAGIL